MVGTCGAGRCGGIGTGIGDGDGDIDGKDIPISSIPPPPVGGIGGPADGTPYGD